MNDDSEILDEPCCSRKERQREQHRSEILGAAEQIFARKGYHAATIEEIARESQFAVGTLYNLFKNKDELYHRVIEGFICQFLEELEEKVLKVTDSEQAIAALIDLRVRHFERHREFIRISLELSPASRLDPCRALPKDLQQQHERYVKAVTAIFKRGVDQGVFDAVDPLYLTLGLDGIINAFMAYWSQQEVNGSLEERIHDLQRQFIGRIKVRLTD